MDVAAPVLQFGGAMPLIVGLLVLLAAALGAYALRDGREHHRTGSADDGETVCPRCHHSTDATATACPECGKDL